MAPACQPIGTHTEGPRTADSDLSRGQEPILQTITRLPPHTRGEAAGESPPPMRPHGRAACSGALRVRACIRSEGWARQLRGGKTIRHVGGVGRPQHTPPEARGGRGAHRWLHRARTASGRAPAWRACVPAFGARTGRVRCAEKTRLEGSRALAHVVPRPPEARAGRPKKKNWSFVLEASQAWGWRTR